MSDKMYTQRCRSVWESDKRSKEWRRPGFPASHCPVRGPGSMSREVRAAGFIVFRKAAAGIEYLLLQSSRKEAHWTPPKGHVDPGENDLQAAFRETEEEAGLKKQDLAVIEGFESVLKYKVNKRPKSVIYWAAELKNTSAPVIISHEHIGFRWAGVAEACTLAAFPEMVSSLEECDAFLQKYFS